ncbi:flagellin [Novispirillum itersonii]|uniref:flagellin n=1 Tax=Novispirillum itersonii TaxID=189 RepID=UPI00035F6C36|nr:flagellin [Novispirillum itersonii]
MIQRVSTAGLSDIMLRSALSLQSRMAEKQVASASGLVSTTYGGLGAKAGTVLSLESVVSRTQAWSDNTQVAVDRAQSMYSALGSMVDQLSSLRATISAARSDVSGSIDYNSLGAGVLDDLAQMMNLQMDGRYLFSGSRTDTAPVETSKLSVPTVPSTADTAYFQGDNMLASVRVSADQSIQYGVSAGDGGFEKALRSANLVANLTTSPMDDDALTEAYDLATEALEALLAYQGQMSVQSKRLENAQTAQDDMMALLKDRITGLTAVDTAEVTVELSQYESTLQASYSAIGTMFKLSLTDYL